MHLLNLVGAQSSGHRELIDDSDSFLTCSKQVRIQEDELPSSSSQQLTAQCASIVELGTFVPIVKKTVDIGNYVGKEQIDDRTKRSLLLNHWKPPPGYNFPQKKAKYEKQKAQNKLKSVEKTLS